MAALNRPTSIEFIVRPKEDLHLQGGLRKLHRIDKGEPYPCQMQKNQNFSCLFRHYAKHNGLKKEDLIFSFVDELLPDQTPETVHLMGGDEIWVEHRIPEEKEEKPQQAASNFCGQFLTLLETGIHSDITFCVGDGAVELPAHKGIICARSQYFDAMFRVGGMAESTLKMVSYPQHDPVTFRRLLEYLYTDAIKDIADCTSAEVILLLEMANEYVLRDLRTLVEVHAARLVSKDNIAKFMLLTADDPSSFLRQTCMKFSRENVADLTSDHKFRMEVENSPELGLLLFEASVPLHSENSQESFDTAKRRRISLEATPSSTLDQADVPGTGGSASNAAIVPGAVTAVAGANTIAQTNMNVND